MTLGFEERLALRKQVSEAMREQAKQRLFLLDLCQHCHESFERKMARQAFCSTYCRREAFKSGTKADGLRAPVLAGDTTDPRGWVIRTHSRAGYQRGCRCATCREAHTSYMREWHARRKAA